MMVFRVSTLWISKTLPMLSCNKVMIWAKSKPASVLTSERLVPGFCPGFRVQMAWQLCLLLCMGPLGPCENVPLACGVSVVRRDSAQGPHSCCFTSQESLGLSWKEVLVNRMELPRKWPWRPWNVSYLSPMKPVLGLSIKYVHIIVQPLPPASPEFFRLTKLKLGWLNSSWSPSSPLVLLSMN